MFAIRRDTPSLLCCGYKSETFCFTQRHQFRFSGCSSFLNSRFITCFTFSVADQVEPLFPDPATQPEAEAGTETELRSWSPVRIKQAAAALGTPDQTARDAAEAAQTDADANATDIAANTAALADKVNTADLTDNIEGFAVVGDSSEIPTVRYASDSVTEGKLSPQVRAKLAVSSSQQGENISWASMTQTEYDALSTYDSDRIYIIVG